MTVEHTTLNEDESHEIGWRQATDPGAVGAGMCWIDTSGGTGSWVLKVRNAADTGWETVGGGGATADFDYWEPMAPPSSASSYDDEFDNASFNTTLWTEFDNDSELTISEDQAGLLFTPSNVSDIMGCYQANPTESYWSIYTRAHPLARLAANSIKLGIVIAEDLASNPSTCDLITFGLSYHNTGISLMVEHWDDYNSHNTNVILKEEDVPVITGAYLRVRYSQIVISNYLSFDYSNDGISWIEIGSLDTASYFTPDEIGLYIKAGGSGVRGRFSFFRVTTGEQDYPVELLQGDRIDGFRA